MSRCKGLARITPRSGPTQAQQTRRRVVEGSRRIFIDHGYAGTTVAAVADLKGVPPEIIYHAFGENRILLEEVMDITGLIDASR